MLPQMYDAHHNQHLEDLPFWLELAAQTGDPVLELGCGTGRVLIPLAQAGYRLFGIDYDQAMLQFLQDKVNAQTKPTPTFILADISEFYLAMLFPLIILPCNTFSTLQQRTRLACLDRVHKHLKSGGIFAVSIPNPKRLQDLPEQAEAVVEDEFTLPQTGNPVQVSSSWRRTKHIFTVTWSYDNLMPDGRVERFTVESVHQIRPPNTYLDEIGRVGLKVIETYGDFDLSPYREASPYLIYLATR